MDPRLVGAFARHGQLLTRRQALAVGATAPEIDGYVARREWVAVRRGVYALPTFWDGLDDRRERPLYAARAASAAMLVPHLISHGSAALELGLPLLRESTGLVHVTRFGVLGSRTRFGVKHHKAPFATEQIVFVDGRPVLDHARTVADIAREDGLTAGVVAADGAMRRGTTRADLRRAVEPMVSWPYVTVVRQVAELADPGAESVLESAGRVLVEELGLGRPQTQFGLRAGGRVAWCDLRIGRHIFEFDGQVKYRPEELGGFARSDPAEVLWREKQRQDFVCGFKLGMSRVVWADVFGAARESTKRRLTREYLDTVARFGSDISDLAPYVIRTPRH